MKRILVYLLIILVNIGFVYHSQARMTLTIVGGSVPGEEASCGYDECETFDATGYDNGAEWTEVNTSGTVDEDETTNCPSGTGWSDKCLEIIQTTNWNEESATWDTGTTRPIVYITFYWYYDAGVGAGDKPIIVRDGSSNESFRLQLSSGLVLNAYVNNNWQDSYSFSADTSYKIEIYLNNTAGEWEWKINGVSQESGAVDPTYDAQVYKFEYNSDELPTVYYDTFEISTSGYPS